MWPVSATRVFQVSWIDNNRRLRHLAHQLESLSLDALHAAESWSRRISRQPPRSAEGGVRGMLQQDCCRRPATGDSFDTAWVGGERHLLNVRHRSAESTVFRTTADRRPRILASGPERWWPGYLWPASPIMCARLVA